MVPGITKQPNPVEQVLQTHVNSQLKRAILHKKKTLQQLPVVGSFPVGYHELPAAGQAGGPQLLTDSSKILEWMR